MREDVVWLEDEFRHDVPDEEWLAVAGQRGWLVITHDRKIRTRPGERRAIMDPADLIRATVTFDH